MTDQQQVAPDPDGQVLATIERRGYGGQPDRRLLVSLCEFQGRQFLSLRVWQQSVDGQFWPSRAGVSVRLKELGHVLDALARAQKMARLDPDGRPESRPHEEQRKGRWGRQPAQSARPDLPPVKYEPGQRDFTEFSEG